METDKSESGVHNRIPCELAEVGGRGISRHRRWPLNHLYVCDVGRDTAGQRHSLAKAGLQKLCAECDV
jgi:hypothetical protein